ncbi:MAG: glycerate kinase [Opitutus sp.]|nr:glycerate kinase [Opitutus sp.]
MRALVAFDKFKDALTAGDACAAARSGLGAHEIDCCPLTDGGEGFSAILTEAAAGRIVPATVTGPRGAPVAAGYGLVALEKIPAAARAKMNLAATGEIAVIEMARASGLALLAPAERDPWLTTSRGTGELIRAAAQAGVRAILLGVGGSATHDVGLGALSVLGLKFRDSLGGEVADPIPSNWAAVAAIEGTIEPSLPPIFIACDVANPLMGTFGAASVYAPQKGLLPEDFTRLEYMTGRMAALLTTHAGKHPLLCETPGAGAAGGIAFGLMCTLGAQLLPGFEFVSAWFNLERRLADADVVLTGEGRFDDSSLQGKGPGSIVRRALELQKPVHVFAGQIAVTQPPAGLNLHALTPPGTPLADALASTREDLRAAVQRTFP